MKRICRSCIYIYFFARGGIIGVARTLMRKRGARNLLAEENGRRGRTEERRVIGILLWIWARVTWLWLIRCLSACSDIIILRNYYYYYYSTPREWNARFPPLEWISREDLVWRVRFDLSFSFFFWKKEIYFVFLAFADIRFVSWIIMGIEKERDKFG